MASMTVSCGEDGTPDRADGRGSTLQTATPGTLAVCTEVPRYPFAYERDGKLMGFEVELVSAVASNLNLKVELRPVMGDRILISVARRLCDVGASAIPTTAAKEGVQLSSGYLDVQHTLLVRRDNAGRFTDIDALQGQTIGVGSRTTAAEQARAEAAKAGVAVQEFERAEDMIDALVAGRVAGLVQDRLTNGHQTRRRDDVVVTQVLEPPGITYGLAVSKRNASLLDAVNFALADLRTDGTFDELLRPYV